MTVARHRDAGGGRHPVEALLAAAKAAQQDQEVIASLAKLHGDIKVESVVLDANCRLTDLHVYAVPEDSGA